MENRQTVETNIARCGSCGQEMHGTDYVERLRRELAEAKRDAERYRDKWIGEMSKRIGSVPYELRQVIDAAKGG